MLKKRIIFTLLYCDGHFVQSRNFNLQKVGDVNWLEKNYNFKKISYFIDELLVLDISRKEKNLEVFLENLKLISKYCFIPISVGGGINDFQKAKKILSSGADKVLINSNLSLNLTKEISKTYGQQSIIASVDYKKIGKDYKIFIKNSSEILSIKTKEYLAKLNNFPIGEIMLNSIDQDGTGHGLDFKILKFFPEKINKSIIISGGCGNASHLSEGLGNKKIDAVSTANLLNFVGNGLENARKNLLSQNFKLPVWDVKKIDMLKNNCK